jgi:GTPase SAR1 family protein
MPSNEADYVHEMVAVGNAGPVRDNLASKHCIDWFEDHYSATIGSKMSTFCRDVDGIVIKGASWIITNRDDFAELRQVYYQNVSLTILTIEDTSPGSIMRYKEWLDAIHAVCGKIPISIVVDYRSSIDQKVIDAFVSEMDVSRIIMDSANEDATKSAIDRMLREILAC